MSKEFFLKHSAKENMVNLRNSFNKGKNVEKSTPNMLTKEEAQFDLEYLKFILEQGYSGYTFFPKDKFDKGFINISSQINSEISLVKFMDIIKEELAFITDGHLALTSNQHSVGFYRHQDTYITDMKVINETIELIGKTELLPSLNKGEKCYLIAQKSYDEINTICVNIDGVFKELPVHKIQSSELRDNKLVEIKEIGEIIYVRCSTFIGDDADDLERFYELGKKCSNYKNVIWDLSNNLGGNSKFAEMFIKGLNKVCLSDETIYQVQSSLVHAKETGEIKDISYSLEIFQQPSTLKKGAYKGHLHVIINDRVASSGESALTMCECIQIKTVYGCNSLGIGTFGDLLIYYLPHSKITVWCPHKVFQNKIVETKGYSPDIWLDTNDPLQEIIKIID